MLTHWDAAEFDHYLEHNLPSPKVDSDLVVFTDASSDCGVVGVGWVVLSSSGGKLCEGSAWSDEFGDSSTVHELWAVHRALEQLEQMDWLDSNVVSVYTDCNSVVGTVDAGGEGLCSAEHVLEVGSSVVSEVCSRIGGKNVVCVSRNVNKVADSLARGALFEGLREEELRTEKVQYRDRLGRFVSECVDVMGVWEHSGVPHLFVRLASGETQRFEYGRICEN